MVFEYTYSGKLLKEIEAREKEIAMLREDVREMIVKNDYRLLQTYEDLLEKMDDFPEFKKSKEKEIKNYFIEKITEISANIQRYQIKDRYGLSLNSQNLSLMCDIASNNLNAVKEYASLFQGYILWDSAPNEHKELLEELYDYLGLSITKLYNKEVFACFTYDMKVACFRDTIHNVHNNIREWQIDNKIENNSFLFQRLTEMMKDDDIKTFLSLEFAPESTSLECYARILDEYYPASSKVFEEDNKMPKEIRDFIDAVENLSKEKNKEEELEI